MFKCKHEHWIANPIGNGKWLYLCKGLFCKHEWIGNSPYNTNDKENKL